MKSFNLFGVNLGPFSAHDCPDVHFRPAVVDWVMEGVALLLVVLGWVGVLWQYTTQGGQADGVYHAGRTGGWQYVGIGPPVDARVRADGDGCPPACALHPLPCARECPQCGAAIRVRGAPHVCVVRLLRAFNVCISLLFAVGPWTDHHLWARIACLAALVLMVLSLVVYYVVALWLK